MIKLKQISFRIGAVLTVIIIGVLIGLLQVQDAPLAMGERTRLTAVIASDPVSFDPVEITDSDSLAVALHIYDTLVNNDNRQGFAPRPGLAKSWSASDDGLTWTFDIRSGAKFHDGAEANAEAVVYNIKRWWDPEHPQFVEDFIYFNYLFGGPKGNAAAIFADVKIIKPSKVQIQLTAPESQLLAKLSFLGFGIVSPQAIQAGTVSSNPVGSGPFKFEKWQPGQYVDLSAAEHWAGMPQSDDLRFQIISDPAGRLTALKSGQVHASDGLQDLLDEVQMAGNLRVLWHPANNTGYLGMNRAFTPLNNQLVREAIAHAINRQAIVDNNYSPGDQVAKDMIPLELWGADPDNQEYVYDPALAINLLKQAGYPDGFTVTLSYRDVYRIYLPNPASTAQAVARDLNAVGIKTMVQEIESSEFLTKYYDGELELFLLGWVIDYPHPYNMYAPLLCGPQLGPRDDKLCDTLDQALLAASFLVQEALFQKASRRINETVPVLPIAHGRLPLVVHRDLMRTGFNWVGVADYSKVVYTNSHAYFPMIVSK